jgi:hypothetical protein
MLFLAEQHLVAAKQVRINGATRAGADLEKFIKMSNSFVVCARLAANSRGGIDLDRFDWKALSPDWSVVDQQIRRLAPPYIDGPPLVPDLWLRW